MLGPWDNLPKHIDFQQSYIGSKLPDPSNSSLIDRPSTVREKKRLYVEINISKIIAIICKMLQNFFVQFTSSSRTRADVASQAVYL